MIPLGQRVELLAGGLGLARFSHAAKLVDDGSKTLAIWDGETSKCTSSNVDRVSGHLGKLKNVSAVELADCVEGLDLLLGGHVGDPGRRELHRGRVPSFGLLRLLRLVAPVVIAAAPWVVVVLLLVLRVAAVRGLLAPGAVVRGLLLGPWAVRGLLLMLLLLIPGVVRGLLLLGPGVVRGLLLLLLLGPGIVRGLLLLLVPGVVRGLLLAPSVGANGNHSECASEVRDHYS